MGRGQNGRGRYYLPVCLRPLPRGSRLPETATRFNLPYPVTVELLDDVGVHGLGIGYIHIALGNRACPLLGEPPTIEGGAQPRIDPKRRVEIGDRVFRQSALEVNQAAAIQR